MVDVEGVKRTDNKLSYGRMGGQLTQNVGFSLSDVDPVLSYDTVHLQWGAPVQKDVSGVEGITSGV